MIAIVKDRKTNCMAENHGNVDTKNINLTLEVEKYPMHTEYKLEWRNYTEFTLAASGLPAFYLCSISISARHSTFIISTVNSLQLIPDLTIDEELCQDPHNMTLEDWTLLMMLYPQITTQH